MKILTCRMIYEDDFSEPLLSRNNSNENTENKNPANDSNLSIREKDYNGPHKLDSKINKMRYNFKTK